MTTKLIVTNLFEKDAKELFSIPDILGILKLSNDIHSYKRIENIVRNLRVAKKIYRHKEKDVNNDFQYAVKMEEKDIAVWKLDTEVSMRNKGILHGKRKTLVKRKGGLLSKKEIQSMFAAQYNTLARLEDEAMKIIEEFEVIEKEMLKIRNFIGR